MRLRAVRVREQHAAVCQQPAAMVLGVHAGLTVVSGYSDPGFLWGLVTLTYVFSLVHAFSTAVAERACAQDF